MNNQNKTRGAVIVTRVSTGEQAKHGTSLEGQLEACREKALALNLPVVGEYEDGGVSGGFLLLREGMQKAIADIQAGRADTLICATISRYSRDTEHQQAIKKAVRAAGGRVAFCDMDFDDTPEGDLAFGLMGQFAEYEKKVIRDRTMKGRRRRAEQGSQPMRTSSPYGYHVVTTADILRGEYPADQAGRYIVEAEKAALVREMFTWYDTGRFSLAGVAKHLNTQDVPTPRGGKLWCATTIRAILLNSAYKGEAIFGRIEKRMDESRVGQINPQTGRPIRTPMRQTDAAPENQVVIPCPAIISEEVWDRVQAKMKENKVSKSGNPQRARMLAGRVYCPGCGGTMTFTPEKRNGKGLMVPANYTCFRHAKIKRLTGEFVCNAKTYRQTDTEAAVASALEKAAKHPDWVQSAIFAYHKTNKMTKATVDHRKELQAVDRALEQLKEEQAAAVKGQIAGIMQGVPAEAYADVFADLAARRKDLEDRRGLLARASRTKKSSAETTSEEASLETILSDVHHAITSPEITPAEKRDFIGRVVDRVICRKGGGDVIFMPGLFGEVCAETLQADKTVSVGDLSSSIVHPREVYKDAVVASAASIIVAHNHPSGDPTPSAEDVAVTKRLIQSGEIMGIDLLDHIVLGDGTFVSLKERGLI